MLIIPIDRNINKKAIDALSQEVSKPVYNFNASTKDDAELAMIVDLLRNDIGKVCVPGSVRVSEHKRLEAYRNVYHLSCASLPRVMAGAVCRQLADWGYAVHRRPVAPGMLEHADQVLATNALMGAVPVHCLDQVALPQRDDLWRRINDAVIA